MGDIWGKFLSNCKRSIEIGIIRYSLYNLSVLIIPMILMVIPWLGLLSSLILGNYELLLGSMVGVLFSLVIFIATIFIGNYTENCLWKAYIYTIETGEKVGYKDYFKCGYEGYWSFFGKTILNVFLPVLGIMILVGIVYLIPVVGYIAGDFLVSLSMSYISYRFYAKLIGANYDDFKMQLNNYMVLIIISTILSFFGLVILDTIVVTFFTPISLILITSKVND